MGWTVLYIAFGVVALWLLGEVLLQYKARLRWRLVAFTGFLGVVLGVVVSSVPVIALGAVAFGTGQTFVTLSFRRGFSAGWALGGKPGTSRRRREGRAAAVHPMPSVPDPDDAEEAPAGEAAYAPGGLPPAEDPPTTGLTAYREHPEGGEPAAEGYGERYPEAYAEEYTEEYAGAYAGVQAGPGEGGHGEEYGSGEWAGYGGAEAYAADYAGEFGGGYGEAGIGAGEAAPGAYAPPYQDAYGAHPHYAPYPAAEPYTGGPPRGADDYADQPAYSAAYAGYPEEPAPGAAWTADPYAQDTPPGGVWLPPQREATGADHGYGYPPPQPGPYDPYQPGGYDPGAPYPADEQRY